MTQDHVMIPTLKFKPCTNASDIPFPILKGLQPPADSQAVGAYFTIAAVYL